MPFLRKNTAEEEHAIRIATEESRNKSERSSAAIENASDDTERSLLRESQESTAESHQRSAVPAVRTPATPPSATSKTAKTPVAVHIENIMEENLSDFYLQLNPREQLEFKKLGEETASSIERLIVTARVTVQKVFQLIASWLRIIPHVNRFYLEQEAKIKADRIMREIAEKRTVS